MTRRAHEGPEAGRAAGEVLARVLAQAGCEPRRSGEAVVLPSGLRLEAALMEVRDLADGRAATVTRIAAFYEALFPGGLPELQQAAGENARQAMAAGFAAWARCERPALEDAVRAAAGAGVRDSALLAIRYPARGQEGERVYQAILGPIVRMGSSDEALAEEIAGEIAGDDELCPACMTTRLQDALRDRLRPDGCTGIRLFAGRDENGALAADCRIDGEPFAEGAERLLAYARSWPGRGLEFRTQYVVIRLAPRARGR